MKKVLMLSILTTLLYGCGSKEKTMTGFLSDYSKLKKESDSTFRYVDEAALAKYSSFIVDPVQVRFYSGSKSQGKLSEEQLSDLTNYMHSKIVEAVQNAGKTVAQQPAAGVARVRVSLSDIRRSTAVSIIPQASLLGAGIGGAAMEAEVVDSMTGKQVGAVVQSGRGSGIPFTNLGNLNAAKRVMDRWAQRFQERLVEYSKAE